MAKKKATKNTAKAVEESKADKFKRLGAMRATKAINAMRGLQKLSNKNNYEYTPEQVEKIVTVLKDELEAVYNSFTKTGAAAKETFTL